MNEEEHKRKEKRILTDSLKKVIEYYRSTFESKLQWSSDRWMATTLEKRLSEIERTGVD